MQAALLILELLLKYGPAVARAATEAINKKTPVTIEEWNAIFDLAEEPYGLTANQAVLALGKIEGTGSSASPRPTPSDVPPGAIIIVKTYPPTADGREVWCDATDDCFVVIRSTMAQAGNVWVAADGRKFYLNV
jgi:hypothetical protein